MLTRFLRLLVLLLVACPIVEALGAEDLPSSAMGRAVVHVGDAPGSDDTPRLTRLGNEIDDLREAVPGPVLRFEPIRRPLSDFAPRQADRIDTFGDPPPDRPPRSVA